MTKRVLVTGARGFIGRESLPALAALGYDVHAVSSQGTTGGPATWHRADLMDRAQVTRLVEEVAPSHLLHFAWYTAHGRFWTSTENLRWVEASLALLSEFAERGGRRAVLAGTCAEYDWRFGYCSEPVTPLAPSTLYGTCKHALRIMAEAYAVQAGLSLAWGRVFYLHGPHEPPTRLVPSVVRSMLEGGPVRCSHGNQIRDFLHVQDGADAFAALLDCGVEGPVNVASGRPVAIRDVVRMIADLVPSGNAVPIEFGAVAAPPGDPPLLVADVRRLAGEVGWTPRHDLRGGLSQTINAWAVLDGRGAGAGRSQPAEAR